MPKTFKELSLEKDLKSKNLSDFDIIKNDAPKSLLDVEDLTDFNLIIRKEEQIEQIKD